MAITEQKNSQEIELQTRNQQRKQIHHYKKTIEREINEARNDELP
jgi:hypothetical protein